MATADAGGRCDVSPKGGPPGFVRVLDEHHLGIPDLSGNNRLDSLQNLVANPGIGLLFLVPAFGETLRVNGRAAISTEPTVLDACAVGDVAPRVVVLVTVEEAYIHCAKALRRAGLWEPEQWPDLADLPSAACMLRDHYDLPDMDVTAVERRLAESYARTLWLAGGDTPSVTGD
jgi:PPOX class probable FMN-dependent enzyme